MKAKLCRKHEENITAASRDYLCLFRPDAAGGYLVTCPELPPMIAFGETLDEARTNARDDIEAWLDVVDRSRDWQSIGHVR